MRSIRSMMCEWPRNGDFEAARATWWGRCHSPQNTTPRTQASPARPRQIVGRARQRPSDGNSSDQGGREGVHPGGERKSKSAIYNLIRAPSTVSHTRAVQRSSAIVAILILSGCTTGKDRIRGEQDGRSTVETHTVIDSP